MFPSAKLVSILAIVVAGCFSGCKDDDVQHLCCRAVDPALENFIFAPNLFSPDGFGPASNEYFTIVPRLVDSLANAAVRSVFNLKIFDVDGYIVFSKDTIYDSKKSDNHSNIWDFIGADGNTLLGSYKVQFDFIDQSELLHHTSYSICVVSCQYVEDLNLKLDRNTCRSADQIDPEQGFVFQNSEQSCYFK